jgi:hypothetical protein
VKAEKERPPGRGYRQLLIAMLLAQPVNAQSAGRRREKPDGYPDDGADG